MHTYVKKPFIIINHDYCETTAELIANYAWIISYRVGRNPDWKKFRYSRTYLLLNNIPIFLKYLLWFNGNKLILCYRYTLNNSQNMTNCSTIFAVFTSIWNTIVYGKIGTNQSKETTKKFDFEESWFHY